MLTAPNRPSCINSGIGSIPAWMRPPHTLSGGEQARATNCLRLQNDRVVIDDIGHGIEVSSSPVTPPSMHLKTAAALREL